VIPVTVDDLAANGLIGDAPEQTCWERSVETITARKHEVRGLAIASEERIEAYVLHAEDGEILALRSPVEDDGALLGPLLSRLGPGPFRVPKVHPDEPSRSVLEALGFRPAGAYRLFGATARSA
jgi:hypothetical protein